MRRYAVDVEGAVASHNFSDEMVWPVSLPARTRIVEAAVDVLDAWIADIDDAAERRIVGLAAPGILTALLKVAVFAEESRAAGSEVQTAAAELVWKKPTSLLPLPSAPFWRSALSVARTVRSTVSLFGLQNGARALVRGDRWLLRASAISLEAAASEKRAFVVADLRSFTESAAVVGEDTDASSLANRLKERVLDPLVSESRFSSVLRLGFLAGLADELSRAKRLLQRLGETKRLPSVLWTGSGGHFYSRALALEVLRRDGTVRRFAHGGGFGLDGYGRCRMLIEACGASEIAVSSEALASSINRSRYTSGSAFTGPSIIGLRGDPQFRSLPRRCTSGSAPKPILYMGSMYTGTHVHVPPPPPGQLYFLWQLKLTAELERMGYDVLCRPHPENVVLYGHQPLARFRPISREPFKDVVANVLLAVFDYPFSTAFWETLCTDVPVVLLDLIGAKFQPEISAALSRRVALVDVPHDACNRPVIDPDRISEAIRQALLRTDPGEFQTLLSGVGR